MLIYQYVCAAILMHRYGMGQNRPCDVDPNSVGPSTYVAIRSGSALEDGGPLLLLLLCQTLLLTH